MADLQVSSWANGFGHDNFGAIPGDPVQNLAFRLENRWVAAREYLSDYIDAIQKDEARYHDSPPATDENILATTNKPPRNHDIAVAHDLLQRELVFCKGMLSTAGSIFSGPHRGRITITTILACAKCMEIFAPVRAWNPQALKISSIILWGLLATSLFITALSPLGEWLARRCSNSIEKIQALLRTNALGEKHRYSLTETAWTMTFQLLSIEATISRGKRYLRSLFRHQED
ncbi:hypothetical protein EYR41_005106 [Orbilia oligospora]|uniref:Uncharacterized protein n=1 Tax=Orbilia oligospora TaxID=2813651 RepID=A0A7C8P312_ORBOL|nr:hypothetical protein TWF751_001172 [Orbilia oligospora]TGJ69037.1 hypothetical protein EYR41_005106 [Orbilia oligospora]